MQILGLLGIYFDGVVVKVKNFLLLFRLALAIMCTFTRKFVQNAFTISHIFLAGRPNEKFQPPVAFFPSFKTYLKGKT